MKDARSDNSLWNTVQATDVEGSLDSLQSWVVAGREMKARKSTDRLLAPAVDVLDNLREASHHTANKDGGGRGEGGNTIHFLTCKQDDVTSSATCA